MKTGKHTPHIFFIYRTSLCTTYNNPLYHKIRENTILPPRRNLHGKIQTGSSHSSINVNFFKFYTLESNSGSQSLPLIGIRITLHKFHDLIIWTFAGCYCLQQALLLTLRFLIRVHTYPYQSTSDLVLL